VLKNTALTPDYTIGFDLGDKVGDAFIMNANGQWTGSAQVPMTPAGISRAFAEYPEARVVIEVGTHSPWIERILSRRGFEVIVANPRRTQLIARSYNKHDRADAELLCRQGYSDPLLLSPIRHRGQDAQIALATIRSRDCLVRMRTMAINSVRGLVKSFGFRVPRCSAETFPKRTRESLATDLFPGFEQHLNSIEDLTTHIRAMDQLIEATAMANPAAAICRQVPGVGPLTALTFVLTIEDPERFRRSRQVGAYLGLTPRREQSGDRDPELPITKAGDEALRRLLVSAARYILRDASPDTDLKRFGLRLSRNGSKRDKNRAAIAVARKLAVLLHRLWLTGEVYEPLDYVTTYARLPAEFDQQQEMGGEQTAKTQRQATTRDSTAKRPRAGGPRTPRSTVLAASHYKA